MKDFKGKVIIVSAPSGAGKTTIVHRLMDAIPELMFSVSASSREKRENETHGKDYYFLSEKEFKQAIYNDDFLEWEEVYPGQFYGTLQSEIDRIWDSKKHVIFDVDVIGGLNLKKLFADESISIFIMPPNVETLRKRLEQRATESREKIQMRIKKATFELEMATGFDEVVLNDELESAVEKSTKAVLNFLAQ